MIKNDYVRNLKNNKAITLLALVITIIIMLILAGVTINAMTGDNGLFSRAKQAKEETTYANALEKVALAVNMSYDENGELNKDLLKDNLNNIDGISKKVTEIKYDLKVVVDGYEFTISQYGAVTGEKQQVAELPENTKATEAGTEVKTKEGWELETTTVVKTSDGSEVTGLAKVSTVYAISVGNGDTVPVPKNFYYVGGTLNSGVVISDDERDKNKYAGKEDVPAGVIYNSDGTIKQETSLTEEEEKNVIFGNQFVWIPCKASEYKKITDFKIDTGANAWSATYETKTNLAELSQIEKYGGFYIGRYETGTSKITFANSKSLETPSDTLSGLNSNYTSSKVTSGTITSKAGEIPWYHSDYTTSVEMTKKMYETDEKRKNYVTSGLVTGTMWDMAMKFISAKSDYSDLKSTSWGNYNNNSEVTYSNGNGRYVAISNQTEVKTGDKYWVASDTSYHFGIRTTASSEGVKKKNMYDLAGNLWEWTQEAAYPNSTVECYMLRGGAFTDPYTGRPACCRGCDSATDTNTNYGFRPSLYIK